MSRYLVQVGGVAISVAAAVLLGLAVHWVVRRVAARLTRTHPAFMLLLTTATLYIALGATTLPGRGWLRHAVGLAVIGACAWLLGELLFVAEDLMLPRVRTDIPDNLRARRVQTQLTLVRRVTAAALAVVAVAAMLLTFREARLVGTGLLASAGVVAAITAFAANALLTNLIAGIQLAFGGALRLDDVVVVEGEWGRIEQITLTYIVVHIWDDRRLIMPTSYFTTKPFENWTHASASLLGEVVIDADWRLPVDETRQRLRELLEGTPLWDGRVCVLQVVDAADGRLTVRALVSARDAPTLWDLRCLVREGLVVWLRHEHQEAIPRVRALVGGAEGDGPLRVPVPRAGDDRVFSGDPQSVNRGLSFAGPAPSGFAAPTPGRGEERDDHTKGESTMATTLDGLRVAMLATNGVEEVEYTEPRAALEKAGARVDLVSPQDGEIQSVDGMDKSRRYPVDRSIDEARAEEYGALVLPGGVANPDFLRVDPRAVAFVRSFVEAGKPIGAICHGPWTLIEAGAVRGRTVTSWPSLRTDLTNAGATWVDEEVRADHGLVTSRKPDDLPAFCGKLIEEFAPKVPSAR